MCLTCFLLDFTQHAEEGWLHAMAVERVFPAQGPHIPLDSHIVTANGQTGQSTYVSNTPNKFDIIQSDVFIDGASSNLKINRVHQIWKL
jgi:hypothetical protein